MLVALLARGAVALRNLPKTRLDNAAEARAESPSPFTVRCLPGTRLHLDRDLGQPFDTPRIRGLTEGSFRGRQRSDGRSAWER